MGNDRNKPIIATVLEILFIITLLAAFVKNSWFYSDIDSLNLRLILPGILFILRFLYAIPDIAMGFAAALAFLDSIGINGVPAIALSLLMIIGILNFTSSDKIWAEALKIMSGFTTGSFAQKATFNYMNKRDKNHEEENK